MSLLLVITKLDLDLQGSELGRVVQPDGVGPVQDGLPGLLVQQVELDRVPGVDVCVAVKVLPLQQQDVGLHDALLSQGFAVVHPVDWNVKKIVSLRSKMCYEKNILKPQIKDKLN